MVLRRFRREIYDATVYGWCIMLNNQKQCMKLFKIDVGMNEVEEVKKTKSRDESTRMSTDRKSVV